MKSSPMRTKILEFDIARDTVLSVTGDYERCWVLVRHRRQPLGWLSLSVKEPGALSKENLKAVMRKQLGNAFIPQAFVHSILSKEDPGRQLPAISVVICTRNRTGHLKGCLEALQRVRYHQYEIIIVDNAPSNDATYQLTNEFAVRYIREERPGLDWARNRGIEEAAYGVVAFTDDDVRVDPDWLQVIGEIFSNDFVMGASGYVAPAELETPSQSLFELHYGGMGHGFKRRVLKREILNERQLLWASNFGIGANMAFRKEVFDQIGRFDTSLDVGTPSHGAGDVEMFHRLVTQGHVFVYEPSMLVWHYHRREEKALQRQIRDNGRSFGCYLISCFRKKTVSRYSIIQFLLMEWFGKWNLRNLIRPKGIPRLYSLRELAGLLSSPWAYWKTKRNDRQIRERFGKEKKENPMPEPLL
jgi:GT2 family glycosyltransferase